MSNRKKFALFAGVLAVAGAVTAVVRRYRNV